MNIETSLKGARQSCAKPNRNNNFDVNSNKLLRRLAIDARNCRAAVAVSRGCRGVARCHPPVAGPEGACSVTL